MRLIDADKLIIKLNESQIENTEEYKGLGEAKQIVDDMQTVNAVSEEVYTREYNLRKDAELKVYKLEKAIDEIRAEIKEESYSKQCFNDDVYEYEDRCVDLEDIFRIIDEKVKECKV